MSRFSQEESIMVNTDRGTYNAEGDSDIQCFNERSEISGDEKYNNMEKTQQ